VASSNRDEYGISCISSFTLLRVRLLNIHRFLAKPLLPLNKHVPIRKDFRDVAFKALCRKGIPPPQDALAIFNPATAFEEGKLWRLLHFTEHLPDGKLLIEKKSLAQWCRDGNVARGDADRLPVALKMDFASLCYGLLG
jgi:hypothetical protein